MIGLIVLIQIAALVGWWLTPAPRISEASYAQIHVGMTIAEVEEILGKGAAMSGYSGADDSNGIQIWEDGVNWIVLIIGEGRVRDKIFFHRTLWQRLDDWYQGAEYDPSGGKVKRLEGAT